MNNKDEDYKIFEVNVKLQHYINESEKSIVSKGDRNACKSSFSSGRIVWRNKTRFWL